MTQLDTTLDGSWEQTTTEDGLEYKHTSGVLRVVRYAPDEVDFALCVTLDPDVYGGLDTLSNVVIGPMGRSTRRAGNMELLKGRKAPCTVKSAGRFAVSVGAVQAVADLVDGLDVVLQAELAAQAVDMYVHGAALADKGVAPGSLEQLAAA